MKLFTLILIASLAALAAGSPSLCQRQSTLDDFIGSQRDIALQGVLNNIGGGGSLVPGADPGIVVASPSRENPDYFFTWTRDSALTLIMLVDEYVNGDESLQNVFFFSSAFRLTAARHRCTSHSPNRHQSLRNLVPGWTGTWRTQGIFNLSGVLAI